MKSPMIYNFRRSARLYDDFETTIHHLTDRENGSTWHLHMFLFVSM